MANTSQHPAVIAYKDYIKTLSGAAWTEARRKVVDTVAETLPLAAESNQRYITLFKESRVSMEYGEGIQDACGDAVSRAITYPKHMDTQALKAALEEAGFNVDCHVDYTPSDWLRVWVE